MLSRQPRPTHNWFALPVILAVLSLLDTNAHASDPLCHVSLAAVQGTDDPGKVLLAKHGFMMFWPPSMHVETGTDPTAWPVAFDIENEASGELRKLRFVEEKTSAEPGLMLAYFATEDGEPLQDGVWSVPDSRGARFSIPPLTHPASPGTIDVRARVIVHEAHLGACCQSGMLVSTCYSHVELDLPDAWRESVSRHTLLQTRLVLDPTGNFFDAQDVQVDSFLVYANVRDEGETPYLVLSACYEWCNGLHLPDWYGGERLVGAIWPYGLENSEELMLRFEIDLQAPNSEMEAVFRLYTEDESAGKDGCTGVPRGPTFLFGIMLVVAVTRRVLQIPTRMPR